MGRKKPSSTNGKETCRDRPMLPVASPAACRRIADPHDFPRSRGQRDRLRLAARRVLCRGHGRGDDLLRHARHRQYRPPGLHHARVICRLYRQFQLRDRPDPDRRRNGSRIFSRRHGGLPDLLLRLRTARRGVDPGSRLLLRSIVRRRGRADPGVRRRLPVCRRPLYRSEPASRLCRPAVAHAGPVPGLAADARGIASLSWGAPLSAAQSSRCRRTGWHCS